MLFPDDLFFPGRLILQLPGQQQLQHIVRRTIFVEVLKDGLVVSNVNRNDIVKIPTSEPCKLKFKCSFRSAECFARPGDHVLLAFNRITGSLEAKVTDDKNAQTEMEIVKGKGRSRTLWSFIICAALLALAIALNN